MQQKDFLMPQETYTSRVSCEIWHIKNEIIFSLKQDRLSYTVEIWVVSISAYILYLKSRLVSILNFDSLESTLG